MENPTLSKRLLSLDVLRGLTVFCMIIVNNGGGPEKFTMLGHSQWNGMTPCDLVFPFFLFMIGVSIYLSMSKFQFKPSKQVLWKIAKRTFWMFFIGVALHAFEQVLVGEYNFFPNLRIWGVLERLAMCYGIAAVISLYVPVRKFWMLIVGLLGIYTVIILTGNGYAQDETNIALIIDNALIGHAHCYEYDFMDPEGLLGTIPAIAHTLIGVIVGKFIADKQKSLPERLINIFALSIFLIVTGYVLTYGLPLNKKIWSPSYTLVTTGLASGMLGLLTVLIDCKGYTKWTKLFQMYGVNCFFLYAFSEFLAPIFNVTGITDAVYNGWATIFSPCWASLMFSLSFEAVMFISALILWKKKIFIKI